MSDFTCERQNCEAQGRRYDVGYQSVRTTLVINGVQASFAETGIAKHLAQPDGGAIVLCSDHALQVFGVSFGGVA